MSEKALRDSLIKGTLILALAAFVARFLGMLLRAPLLYLIGEEGMAAYTLANNIYMLLLIIATAGIPSTLSKMVSERLALNQEAEAMLIYKAAVRFALTAGVLMAVLLFAAAPLYARLSEIEEAALSVRAIAPALLLFPLIAIMRGYFQGRQMMKAGGLSQIAEQFVRVITAIGLAYLLMRMGQSAEWGAAGASFGAVTGSIAALSVMIYYSYRLRRLRGSAPMLTLKDSGLTYKKIYQMIFKLSIPIVFISMAVPALNVIDSTITVPLLQSQIGQTAAKETVGLLGAKAQSLAGIPPILAIALSTSILPIVSSAYARKDIAEVSSKASQALRLSMIAGLPLVLMLMIGARPVNGLLFPDTEGTGMIVLMVFGSIFQILMMISASILMGMGHTKEPMTHVFAGLAGKLVCSWALSIWFGIYGIIAATIFCFCFIFILNVRTIKRYIPFQLLHDHWQALVWTAAAAAAAGLLAEFGINPWIRTGIAKLDYFVQAALIGAVVSAVYGIATVKWKAVPQEDIEALPGPVRRALSKLKF